MIIHVRNFGKIESADIDLSNLIVLVGENNSGKTYLMQLIYGLFSFFYSRDFNSFLMSFNSNGLNFNNDLTVIKSNDDAFYKMFQDELNAFLVEYKDDIIRNIFHTQNLTIESLSVEFKHISDDISMVYKGEYSRDENTIKEYAICKNGEVCRTIGFGSSFHDEVPNDVIIRICNSELMYTILSELIGFSLKRMKSIQDITKPFIYLPASRSGIMLLYANYLSKDAQKDKHEDSGFIIENEGIDDIENEYGLTEPVYNFLMFLLKHKNSEIVSDYNKDIISFIDENIINGHFEKIGNTMRYKPKKSNRSIPMYLSSSLVSELAPIYQILSGVQQFSFIMYDEIETCQHPTKQLQLARLLVRMVNAGYKMIVSTHSDTMAAAINNIITFSSKKNKKELMYKLNYEEDDILKSDNVKAYQFVIDGSGKTKVIEVPSHFSVGVGFDFDLFNKANDKIYNDAVALSEVE